MTELTKVLVLTLQTMLPSVDPSRVDAVTQDIAAVVQEEISNETLTSSIEKTQALAMLTAAVFVESGFKKSIEKCEVTGDGGKSVGLGQVMVGQNWKGYSKKEICKDRKLQLRLALHVIDKCWVRTPRPAAAFRCYAAGDAAVNSTTAENELVAYAKFKKIIDLQITRVNIPRTSCKFD